MKQSRSRRPTSDPSPCRLPPPPAQALRRKRTRGLPSPVAAPILPNFLPLRSRVPRPRTKAERPPPAPGAHIHAHRDHSRQPAHPHPQARRPSANPEGSHRHQPRSSANGRAALGHAQGAKTAGPHERSRSTLVHRVAPAVEESLGPSLSVTRALGIVAGRLRTRRPQDTSERLDAAAAWTPPRPACAQGKAESRQRIPSNSANPPHSARTPETGSYRATGETPRPGAQLTRESGLSSRAEAESTRCLSSGPRRCTTPRASSRPAPHIH